MSSVFTTVKEQRKYLWTNWLINEISDMRRPKHFATGTLSGKIRRRESSSEK